MSFNFSKIKNLSKCNDMLFNVMLKYKVSDGNSLDFVKDYMTKNTPHNDTMGVKATKLFTPEVVSKIVEILKEKKDYYRKTENVVDKAAMKQILLDNRGDLATAFRKFNEMKTMEEIIYITPVGVVSLMDEDCKEFLTDELKALYYNVMLLCLYETDQMDNENDRVTF
tara:strand:- start:570 stop:1073 length:504 start_codon:yes stop_codon:yes gene_type:complete